MKDNKGFTLFELTIAVMILSVAVMSLISLVATCMKMDAMSEQMNIAIDAATNKMEEVRNTPFDDIVNTYGADEVLPEGIHVGWFDVEKLEPGFADTDGMVGRIMVFTNELIWSSDATYAGLPKDLNGNSMYEWGDLIGTPSPPKLLPVVIKIEWDGIGRVDRTFSLRTLISDRD